MATLDPILLNCPACGEPITIPVSATPGPKQEDGSLMVAIAFDHTPIREHADLHQVDAQ